MKPRDKSASRKREAVANWVVQITETSSDRKPDKYPVDLVGWKPLVTLVGAVLVVRWRQKLDCSGRT